MSWDTPSHHWYVILSAVRYTHTNGPMTHDTNNNKIFSDDLYFTGGNDLWLFFHHSSSLPLPLLLLLPPATNQQPTSRHLSIAIVSVARRRRRPFFPCDANHYPLQSFQTKPPLSSRLICQIACWSWVLHLIFQFLLIFGLLISFEANPIKSKDASKEKPIVFFPCATVIDKHQWNWPAGNYELQKWLPVFAFCLFHFYLLCRTISFWCYFWCSGQPSSQHSSHHYPYIFSNVWIFVYIYFYVHACAI